MNEKLSAYIGDVPKEVGHIDDSVEVNYFIKALETRLKYCPNDNVQIVISAQSAKNVLDALKMRDCKECQKIFNGFSKEDQSVYNVPTDRKAYKRPFDVEKEVDKWRYARSKNGIPWVCPTCGNFYGFNYGQTLMQFQCGRCGALWKCMNFDEVSSEEDDNK